jgi:hypothetical protein
MVMSSERTRRRTFRKDSGSGQPIVAAARDTREQAVEYAESIGRDDLMIAAFTAWTEPTPWQARTYGTVDRPIVGRLSRLLKRTGLAPDVRSRLLTAYANELVGEDDPTVMAAAREALDLATDPRLRAVALLVLARDPGREEYSRELVEIGVEHDLLRAMAIVALNDRDAAEEIYADLLPHRDDPPAGAPSLSRALRPVAHTLGELALLLGRDDEAAAQFAQAAAIADQ